MGAGASRRSPVSEERTVETLDSPWSRNSDTIFHCIPQQPELFKNASTVLLEVGPLGFRILRPQLMVPVSVFGWGQIHSWSHAPQHFSFRYFDDSKNAIQHIDLTLRDVERLLEVIEGIVQSILDNRKVNAISDSAYQTLLTALQQPLPPQLTPMQVIAQHIQERYLMSDQGRQIVSLVAGSFDKVEVAVMLHSRLVDQSRFSVVLEALDDPLDVDNVWLRITTGRGTNKLQSHVSWNAAGTTSGVGAVAQGFTTRNSGAHHTQG